MHLSKISILNTYRRRTRFVISWTWYSNSLCFDLPYSVDQISVGWDLWVFKSSTSWIYKGCCRKTKWRHKVHYDTHLISLMSILPISIYCWEENYWTQTNHQGQNQHGYGSRVLSTYISSDEWSRTASEIDRVKES